MLIYFLEKVNFKLLINPGIKIDAKGDYIRYNNSLIYISHIFPYQSLALFTIISLNYVNFDFKIYSIDN